MNPGESIENPSIIENTQSVEEDPSIEDNPSLAADREVQNPEAGNANSDSISVIVPEEELSITEEELSTESEIREPEEYHSEIIEEPDGELVQFNERFRTYKIGEGQYTTIIGGYSGLFLNEDGEVECKPRH